MTLIRLGHSPDPDDAFMFYALAKDLIPTHGFEFEHVLRDIETLNRWAMEGRLEVTAISVHAYASVADKYRLLPHGASMGEQYGPMVVAREAIDPATLPSLKVAVPGLLTSAFLELQLAVGRIAEPLVVPFDEVLDVVERGDADAGLVIHEGQLTYESQGLINILDLGTWWHDLTGGLPLPLGANAVRRDIEGDEMVRLSHVLRDSIQYSLDNRDGALAYAADYGEDGREAVRELLRRGVEAGLIDHAVSVDFVED